MSENKKSIDELLKEIVIENVEEYLNRPVDKDLPKTNTKVNIAKKTGIPPATLGRFLDPDSNSLPSLIEAMEILSVIGKREALLVIGDKSNTQAAKFIKAYYREFLQMNPIASTEEATTPNNEEFLRITNESTSIIEKRIKKENWSIYWMIIFVFAVAQAMIYSRLDGIEVLLKQIIK